jgi:two-component system alkaline phosphatase synthesis response regulator PhoP
MLKVLIVEDDEAMSAALRDGFEYEGYAVTVARDGAKGLRLASEVSPDVIILDVMLPKMSGLDVCKKIRAEKNGVPILMLTARGQEIDKVLGLKTGADDYVTKPFSFLELMARVEAVLRRSRGDGATRPEPAGPRVFGDVEVDFRKCEASKAGRPIELSARELRLLEYFLEHPGEVLGRDRLLNSVWGYDTDSYSRTVDMHVAKLRRKIEDRPEDPRHIVTVHGIGYKFIG